MIDITGISTDLAIADTQVPKAANLFRVQIGALEYAKNFGIDLKFFIDENFQFQNESFKSYLIQRLSESHVDVNQVRDTLEKFYLQYTFVVGGTNVETGGFIK